MVAGGAAGVCRMIDYEIYVSPAGIRVCSAGYGYQTQWGLPRAAGVPDKGER